MHGSEFEKDERVPRNSNGRGNNTYTRERKTSAFSKPSLNSNFEYEIKYFRILGIMWGKDH